MKDLLQLQLTISIFFLTDSFNVKSISFHQSTLGLTTSASGNEKTIILVLKWQESRKRHMSRNDRVLETNRTYQVGQVGHIDTFRLHVTVYTHLYPRNNEKKQKLWFTIQFCKLYQKVGANKLSTRYTFLHRLVWDTLICLHITKRSTMQGYNVIRRIDKKHGDRVTSACMNKNSRT